MTPAPVAMVMVSRERYSPGRTRPVPGLKKTVMGVSGWALSQAVWKR
jgi:hypothetical protein